MQVNKREAAATNHEKSQAQHLRIAQCHSAACLLAVPGRPFCPRKALRHLNLLRVKVRHIVRADAMTVLELQPQGGGEDEQPQHADAQEPERSVKAGRDKAGRQADGYTQRLFAITRQGKVSKLRAKLSYVADILRHFVECRVPVDFRGGWLEKGVPITWI
jgi:hypothetical protein